MSEPDLPMTWLTETDRDPRPAGDRLAALWAEPGILGLPGRPRSRSPRSSRGAPASGRSTSRAPGSSASLALPDLGVLTLDELAFFTRAIVRASGLPVLVDGDTGYGEVLNVVRLVRELEDAGAAAVQLEDQVLPKKCGHLSDKRLVAPEEMARKVAAAARAARHLRIVARTDAVELEGLDKAIARARLYREAGAHVIFPGGPSNRRRAAGLRRRRPGPAPRQHDGLRADAAPPRRRARPPRLQAGDLARLRAAGGRRRDGRLLRGPGADRHPGRLGRPDADAPRAVPADRLPRLRGARRQHRPERPARRAPRRDRASEHGGP